MNEEFVIPEEFNSREKCLEYLCQLKWSNGFTCRKCGNVSNIKGKTWYYRKCKSCGWEESCTSHTFFHKIKFPIEIAFAIVYQISNLRKGMSCNQIAKLYGIRPATAWKFRKRVQMAMSEKGQRSFKHYMRKCVKENQGAGKRSLTIEVGCSSETNRNIRISKVRSNLKEYKRKKWGKERWSGMRGKNYKPRKSKKCMEIDLKFLNEDGNDLTQMMILNLKNWIAGTHHFISMAYLELYLREFEFRFERRGKTLLEIAREVLARMAKYPSSRVQWAKRN